MGGHERPWAATGGHGGTITYNNGFWWQAPLGKCIFVLSCFDTRRDEEKETQNINDVGKANGPRPHSLPNRVTFTDATVVSSKIHNVVQSVMSTCKNQVNSMGTNRLVGTQAISKIMAIGH